jgi:hypothetical protein
VYGLVVADEQKEVSRAILDSFAFWRTWNTTHGYKHLAERLRKLRRVPTRLADVAIKERRDQGGLVSQPAGARRAEPSPDRASSLTATI